MRPRFWMLCCLTWAPILTACAADATPTPDLTVTQVAVHTAAVATLTAEFPTATNTPIDTPTLAPSATPLPSNTPTPMPSPLPSATPTLSPTLTMTLAPTPTPKPVCREAQTGWIGFKRQKRCNTRTGDGCGDVEIWVMKPDGSNQALMCDKTDYNWALEQDRTHPDGTWYLDVARNQGHDIQRIFADGRREWIIVNNRADWDPVLSADGWWLAWVTNRNGNDEIYIKTMDWQDSNQRWLTVNQWEWDKHPTWSPDGHKIAFYSNRADKLNEATRQIWVMDVVSDQGVNLRNISNRPDKVDTDPVWFKWDP